MTRLTAMRWLNMLTCLMNVLLLTRNVIADRPGWALFQLCCAGATGATAYALWRVELIGRS